MSGEAEEEEEEEVTLQTTNLLLYHRVYLISSGIHKFKMCQNEAQFFVVLLFCWWQMALETMTSELPLFIFFHMTFQSN